MGALNFNLCTYSMCKTYINFTPSSKYLFYERCISVATATLRSILRRRQRCSRDYGACRQRRGMRWQFYGGWSDDARRISGCIQTLPRGREERRVCIRLSALIIDLGYQNWHLVLGYCCLCNMKSLAKGPQSTVYCMNLKAIFIYHI